MNNFKLQPGDILVTVNRGDGLWARVKRWGIGPYSHVYTYMGRLALLIDRRHGRLLRVPMIFESYSRGVSLRLLAERYGEEVVVMRLKSGHDMRRIPSVLEAAIKLASDDQARYDYSVIPLHIIPRIFHEKFGTPIPLKYHRNEEQVCSEAVNEIFIRGRLPLLPTDRVPVPGDFVTDSPLLDGAWEGRLSAELIDEQQGNL